MTHRVISAVHDTLTSAMKHSYRARCFNGLSRHLSPRPGTLTSAIRRPSRIRCHNDPSRHCDQPQYVDICDEASVLSTVASMAHRAISAAPRYVNIRDEAFVPDSLSQ